MTDREHYGALLSDFGKAAADCEAQLRWSRARDYEREDAECWLDSIAELESVIDEVRSELERWETEVVVDARRWLSGVGSFVLTQADGFEALLQSRGWAVNDDGCVVIGGDDD